MVLMSTEPVREVPAGNGLTSAEQLRIHISEARLLGIHPRRLEKILAIESIRGKIVRLRRWIADNW